MISESVLYNAWVKTRPLSYTAKSVNPSSGQLNLFINENFTIQSDSSIFGFEKLIRDQTNSGFVITYFDQMKSFKDMSLTADARRILNTPNAGGSSIESETLSFEILKQYFNAKLLKTEMEVPYWPEGGSINDYVVYLFETVIGVSVTRAMNFKSGVFTGEDATNLLVKKLNGICQSSRNSLIKWGKQILHVWLESECDCETLLAGWLDLDTTLRSNTVLVITVARNSKELFVNQSKIKNRKFL